MMCIATKLLGHLDASDRGMHRAAIEPNSDCILEQAGGLEV